MLPGFSKFLFLKKEGASNILRDFTKPVDINTLNKYFSDRPRIYLMQVQRFNSRKGFSVIQISALPHTRPLRDLIGDVTPFYRHYKNIRPWLVTDIDIINAPKDNVNPWKNNSVSGYTKPYLHMKEHFQLDSKRLELDGLYECILCLCCTHSCPSYWWNSDHYVGPAVLLQAFRWLFDSRDMDAPGRITWLSQKSGVYSCNTILSCTQTCPKHLNPGKVISTIKSTISEFENVSLLNRLSSLHSNSGYRISSHDQTSTIFKN
jgi:succinate dehydrogenase/fumarate reductase iron-sulfur protein